MMARNCWCALAAAAPSIALPTCLCIRIDFLSVQKSDFYFPPSPLGSRPLLFFLHTAVCLCLRGHSCPRGSRVTPEKMEFTQMLHLPRTSGLFNILYRVCEAVGGGGGLVYKMYKHSCPTRTPATRLLMAQDSHFHKRHRVTCGPPWRREAICLGGETEGCLFGFAGPTVSPVRPKLQLSACEQMGTNLHLITLTSPPCSFRRVPLSPLAVPSHCLNPSPLKDCVLLKSRPTPAAGAQ